MAEGRRALRGAGRELEPGLQGPRRLLGAARCEEARRVEIPRGGRRRRGGPPLGDPSQLGRPLRWIERPGLLESLSRRSAVGALVDGTPLGRNVEEEGAYGRGHGKEPDPVER